ncbi:MAG: cyanophycin synthetase [Halanaerobiales bacterium]|nr:cyanophycin synthetase [Halanaerobiales bacterium]
MELVKIKVLTGPNIYAYSPVIEAKIDLEEFDQLESNEIPGFNQQLLSCFPGLFEHTCSTGKRGGLVERLKEGTYLGHVTEHLALQLQVCLGHQVYFGKTSWVEDSVYKVILEYKVKEVALFSLKKAIEIITALVAGKTIERKGIIEEGEEINRLYGIGPSTEAILREADQCGIPYLTLDSRNSLYQLGYGVYQKRIEATIASTTSCIGVDIAGDKMQTKHLLQESGIPIPVGVLIESLAELKNVIFDLEIPLVVKPCSLNHGKGVSVGVFNWYDLKKAFYRAARFSRRVIVEEYIQGKDYRLLVVGDRVVAVAERNPPQVIGDGNSTIRELINQENQNPFRGKGHEKPLTRIKIDPTVVNYLYQQGFALDAIPEQGQIVVLRRNGNLSTGGTARDVSDQVHPANVELAIRAVRMLGLDIAGVDVITPDIRIPITEGKGAIIEVNAAPGIRMHLYPTEGRGKNVALDILKYLFPEGNGRIPIIAITGTNGKTTTTRLLGNILQYKYKQVGMTTSDGIFINNRCIMRGDNTGPRSARTLLMDPSIEIGVLETARGGILREGLGYVESDIGVITNITEDHLGVDDINSLADLASVKSLVIETVKKNGYSILNADDPLVVKLAGKSSAPIIFFSSRSNNLVIRRHCEKGGKAIYNENGLLVFRTGEDREVIMEINKIPLTFSGLATHNLQNVLAATAVLLALGLEREYIKKGLVRFGQHRHDNLGRLNCYQTLGLTVILDYGHNPAGFEEVFKFMQRLGGERMVGIIGVPGDRPDSWVIKAGTIAGKYLDQVYIKEDQARRGRAPGEVASLIREGLNQACFRGNSPFIANEKEALRQALEQARRGDVIVCFYEKDPQDLARIIRQGLTEFESKEPILEAVSKKNN